MPSPRLASYYLIAQGISGLLWWVLLITDSPVRDWFFPSNDAWLAGRTLLIADVVMFGLVSIAAGGLALRHHRWAGIIGWVTVGATAYATLVALGWLTDPVGHWLGAVAMTPVLIATFVSVWSLHAPSTRPAEVLE